MVQIMAVLALPPKEDCNMRVSLESLKGTCPLLPLLYPTLEGHKLVRSTTYNTTQTVNGPKEEESCGDFKFVSRKDVLSCFSDLGERSPVLLPGDRGKAIDVMNNFVKNFLERDHKDHVLTGVIGVGGNRGTSLLSCAFRSLLIGLPKVIVSTVASGQTETYLGLSDLFLFPLVVDICGINNVSRAVLSNVGAAFSGMVIERLENYKDCSADNEKFMISLTMFGVTTPCVTVVKERLNKEWYETLSGFEWPAIVLDMVNEVLPVVEEVPVLARVCATDPFHRMEYFLKQLESIGFSRMQNFPPVGLFDGNFRQNLEETRMGYGL